MPDGKTHMVIWRTLFPITLLVAFGIGLAWNWYIALWVVVGGFLHAFGIEPDLDLEGINRSEALWIKLVVFIPLIGWSTLYARIFQKWGGHRSLWTHSPLLSTLIRLLFFGFPFLWIFRQYFADNLVREFAGMFIGLSLSDCWHIFADAITGEMNYGGLFKFNARYFRRWIRKLKTN